MQNKKMLIIIGVCVILVAGGILFFTLGGGISSVEDITHDPRRPQAVQRVADIMWIFGNE